MTGTASPRSFDARPATKEIEQMTIRRSVTFRATQSVAAALILAAIGLAVGTAQSPSAAARGPETVAPLAEKLIDAVVNISTTQTIKGPRGGPIPSVPKGSPFEDLFEEFFSKKGRSQTDRKVSSLGSGFVIDSKEGLIVTNFHVIEGADEITINFSDGSKLKVDKVLGKDTKTDLALLKVTPKRPLTEVKFGSSSGIRVGDWVMAIGNPFGLGGSVSVGIISAKQRDINTGPYDDFLQTDAAINKGNSGGPLFNMDGEVIGVNTAIISPSGGSIGIGFAVPSDAAMTVVDQLRQFGETRRGWLGVKIQSVSEDLAEELGVRENTGALVSSVTPGGPADKSGIKPRDVIVKFDGKDVTSVRGLPRLVAQTPIGREVAVELIRDGKRLSVRTTMARLDESPEGRPGDKSAPKGRATPGQSVAGMTLAPLTDELRSRFKLEKKVKGVVVVEVVPDGPSAKKAIKPGDVIVEAGQEPVESVEDVMKAIDKVREAKRKAVLMRIEDSKGDLRFVAIPID
jgi:serine protease Do